ncbi:hypothetical protein F4560_003237 [Saccharothrix ecbatanensis]|uniref:Uncharacterized protein n=1 Tax=Saccharothrix ecbatanensis TaxID=1105145 RepID=A0A7W9HKF6_9PSEU|nr:DUF6236 family protein [Saccharothrix ecbatanensis]MBB5803469.1 hypothetical protein [Saccharothrix ecbatanensis]
MAGILYYPFIEPPRHVLVQALLYSDELAPIVPPEYDHDVSSRWWPKTADEQLPHFYTPVPFLRHDDYRDPWESKLPSPALPGVSIYTMLDHLTQVIDQVPADDLVVPHHAAARSRTDSWLVTDKVGPRLRDWLLERNLARQDAFVLRVAPVVQHLVLATMARYIGSIRPDLRPYTDRRSAHELATTPVYGERGHGVLLDLADMLPVPGDDIPLPQIIEFRLRHADERQRLVDSIEKLLASLRLTTPDREAAVDRLRPELKEALEDWRGAGRGLLSKTRRQISAVVATATATAGAALPEWAWLTNLLASVGVNLATAPASASVAPSIDVAYLHRLNRAVNR